MKKLPGFRHWPYALPHRYIPRWLVRLHAFLFGFFWLPCPVCGRDFSGSEWVSENTIMYTRSKGIGVCSSECARLTLPPMMLETLD